VSSGRAGGTPRLVRSASAKMVRRRGPSMETYANPRSAKNFSVSSVRESNHERLRISRQ
jgi:hypothetical protein